MGRLRYIENSRTGSPGTLVELTTPLQFYDDDMYIYASADGVLEIVSDTTITLTAPTINLTASTAVALDYPMTSTFSGGTAYLATVTTDTSGYYGFRANDTFTLATGGVHKAISGEVTYGSGHATSIGVAGKTTLTGTFGASAAGYMWGIQGQAHLGASAVMSDSGCIITALRAVLTDDSDSCLTGTKGYLTCFTAGSLLQSNFTTTEWKSIIRIGNWGTDSNFCTFDSEIEVYGRHTDNLFCFYDCIGVADSFISTAGGTTHSGTVKKIACVDQNGDTWYLLLSSAIS